MNEKALEIINHYGIMKQLKYFQSEVFELNEAIIKYESLPEGLWKMTKNSYKGHIIEEMADVMVMLTQFKEYYGISADDIEKVMNEKINRQLERIKN